MVDKVLKLQNGNSIPIVGLGTWQSKPEEVIEAVEVAIDVGYRHIDTAWAYQNEQHIGQAIAKKIKEGVVKRDELFITTKVHVQHLRHEDVKKFAKDSLKNLGLDYVDLLLIHGPIAVKRDPESLFPIENGTLATDRVDHLETWKAMEELYNEGVAKAIGVSNYNSKQIKRLYDAAKIKPSNLQVECHAHFPQNELFEFCKGLNITMTAYAPLGSPNRAGSVLKTQAPEEAPMTNPKVVKIAKDVGKTPAQVLLRWLVQRGIIVIPKSVTPSRIAENFDIWDFELSNEQMSTISSLGAGKSRSFGLGEVTQAPEEAPMTNPKVVKIAKDVGKTPAQVLLRWLVQRGIIVIPKSVTPSRIAENFDIWDFELSNEQMSTISSLGAGKSRSFGLGEVQGHPDYPWNEPF